MDRSRLMRVVWLGLPNAWVTSSSMAKKGLPLAHAPRARSWSTRRRSDGEVRGWRANWVGGMYWWRRQWGRSWLRIHEVRSLAVAVRLTMGRASDRKGERPCFLGMAKKEAWGRKVRSAPWRAALRRLARG